MTPAYISAGSSLSDEALSTTVKVFPLPLLPFL